jgi:hypothetical protein
MKQQLIEGWSIHRGCPCCEMCMVFHDPRRQAEPIVLSTPQSPFRLRKGAPSDHAPLSAKEEDVRRLSVQLATVVSSRRMWVAPSTIPLTNLVGQEPAAGGMDTSS